MNKLNKMEAILMVSSMVAGPGDPVNDDETQAHGHQQEANGSKTKGLRRIRNESRARDKDGSFSTTPAVGFKVPPTRILGVDLAGSFSVGMIRK